MVKDNFPDYADNLYVAFHGRASSQLHTRGFVGVISSRTFVTYRDFEKFRGRLLGETKISALADFGWEVLDGAQVETAAYVTERTGTSADQIGPFYRLLAVPVDQKETSLLEAVQGKREEMTFFARPEDVRKLPGAPICYWSSRDFIEESSAANSLYPDLAYVGLGASPHAFYFRARWEVPLSLVDSRWKRICRGGDFSPFYRANALTIDWLEDGRCVKEYILKKYPYLNGNYGWKIQDEDKYGRAGLTWGKRNERFNIQAMPAGHIFTDEGQGVVPTEKADPLFLLGYLNSSLVAYYLNLTSGLQKHYIYIRPVPVTDLGDSDREAIGALTLEVVRIKQNWDTTSEISPIFLAPAWGLLCSEASVAALSEVCAERRHQDSEAISERRSRINQIVLSSTLLGKEDLNEIQALLDSYPEDEPNIDGLLSSPKTRPDEDISQTSVSYFIGIAFGRWDIRYATGEKEPPPLPDPFDPLPVCPPGMLQNDQGLPAEPKDVPADYPLRISWGGILVDDEGHPEDIVARVQDALLVIWGDRADAIEQEACDILKVKSLRDYFGNPNKFFADHLKRYSKSRRQAPIYWPLSTPSGSYTLWLYYHRLTDQTLYTCINDFIDPKLAEVSGDLNRLQGVEQRSTADERELERLADLKQELTDMRAELLRVAQLPYKPDLNDGVIINAAPLAKLFSLKKWQKSCQDCWDKLQAGDYDWAHLAMHIWPKRVLEKCKTDKSLAIAHNREDLYVEPPEPTKKKRGRKKAAQEEPEEALEELELEDDG